MAKLYNFLLIFKKFDLDRIIGTWVMECSLLDCTLVPCVKSVGEIASEIWSDVE